MLRTRVLLLLGLGGAAVASQDRAPVVPGLHANHGLGEADVGEVLLAELRCTACHEDATPRPLAPDLGEVGARVRLDWLERFLADPAGVQPGTKMPALLPEEGREESARALAHFLVGEAEALRHAAPTPEDVAAGEKLFHTVGCVACHAPRVAPLEGAEVPERPGAADLAHVPEKYDLDSLAAFLFQPLKARPAGRMPDMLLARAEARAIASYLLGADAVPEVREAVDPDLADLGELLYDALACATCHEEAGEPAEAPRAELDPAYGCLGDAPEMPAPRYTLDEGQHAALVSALRASDPPADEQRIDTTLTAFNCIGCHARGEHGGVDPDLNLYFTTTLPDLGEEARIPPQLTDVGAKLRPEWLDRVLFAGAAVRPYMDARMPQFGDRNLAHLPALLAAVDSVEPYPLPPPEGNEERNLYRDTGRKLLGNTGGACVACHNFNGKESVNFPGMDLITSYERLQPSWFARFLIDPQTYRPGIVMPESWPGGVSAHADLDGDTERQLAAIWYTLSLGRSAPDPAGLVSVRNELVVEDLPLTYRGRSSIAGYRGIAVGFPGGWNYAFNAQNGALSALWKGKFVSVRWDGQGAGGFNPSARPVQLAQDVSFYRLESEDEPWPLRPHMDKENPVDPDPLYPKNRGYRFRGYALDEGSVPTFEYRSGAVAIRDRCDVVSVDGRDILRRTLRFEAPGAETLHFRALTGAIEELGDGRYRIPGLEIRLPADVPARLRPLGDSDGERELILTLSLPAGPSDLTIDHDLLD